jgi:hypothetical protein
VLDSTAAERHRLGYSFEPALQRHRSMNARRSKNFLAYLLWSERLRLPHGMPNSPKWTAKLAHIFGLEPSQLQKEMTVEDVCILVIGAGTLGTSGLQEYYSIQSDALGDPRSSRIIREILGGALSFRPATNCLPIANGY